MGEGEGGGNLGNFFTPSEALWIWVVKAKGLEFLLEG
jgi:hypothetical protein